jgi:hypothetical protein
LLASCCPQILAREGDLRYVLVRVREAAESIAFYKGERAEAAVVGLGRGAAGGRVWV